MCFIIRVFSVFVAFNGWVCQKKIIEIECAHLVQVNEDCGIICYISGLFGVLYHEDWDDEDKKESICTRREYNV